MNGQVDDMQIPMAINDKQHKSVSDSHVFRRLNKSKLWIQAFFASGQAAKDSHNQDHSFEDYLQPRNKRISIMIATFDYIVLQIKMMIIYISHLLRS